MAFTPANAASVNGGSSVGVIDPMTLTALDTLNFGTSASDGSGALHVDMATDGSGTCQGASLCGANNPHAATFTITGQPNQAVQISTTGNFTVANGTDQATVGNLVFSGNNESVVSYFVSNGVLDNSGSLGFRMTGSLWLPAGAPSAAYSGAFTVNVDYQ